MLDVKNVAKSYGNHTLWHDLSFTLQPGQMGAIVGSSGSGKSTLLNCVGALDRPDLGEITWKDISISSAGSRQRRVLRKEHLGYLFQDYALVESDTISQNINYATAGPWPWIRRTYENELKEVGLKGRHNEPIYQLSGGEQQRVALARIIAKRPGLILADEPTGALDDANAKTVVTSLRRLADGGAVVLIATHSDQVKNSCDVVVDLEDQSM